MRHSEFDRGMSSRIGIINKKAYTAAQGFRAFAREASRHAEILASMSERINRSQKWAADLERDFLGAYEEHADALFRHCMLRIRDRETAYDIVQETFSRTWLYLSKGKKIEYVRAFLYRVANNLIVDGVRRKRHASLDSLMEADGFEPRDENASDPGDVPDGRFAMKLLGSLDEIYRTAITMRYVDGLTPKEIAVALQVSENVVSVRIHRGIERLKGLVNRGAGDA